MRKSFVNKPNYTPGKNQPLRALATSASVLALVATGALSPSTIAQESNTYEGVIDFEEEVIVTGLKASIQSAQSIKRDAEQAVDSVTASDIGALPDRSVSEALQRIPGVQLQRTNENRDPARLAAEGGDVFVRGLSWVRTELNGRDIFSADSGRSIGFEDISSDLLAGVDVYKSPTAEQVEGGIGGTINLRTRKPFDQSGMLAAGYVDYNYADTLEKGFVSINGIFSNRWQVGDQELGFLISASHGEIGTRTDSIQTGRYQPSTYNQQWVDDNPDTPLPVPEFGTYQSPKNIGWRRIDWEQERQALSASLQYAPSEKWQLTVETIYAKATPKDHERNVEAVSAWGSDLSPDNVTNSRFDANNVLQAGTISTAALTFNHRYGERESSTADFSVNLEYTPNDSWTITGDIQHITSSTETLSMTLYTQPGGPAGDPMELNYSGGTLDFNLQNSPEITLSNPDDFSIQERYWWAAAMDHLDDNNADSDALRIDAEYDFEEGFIDSFRFGIRATDRDSVTRESRWNWAFLSQQHWGGADPANPSRLNEFASDQTHLYEFDDFMRGDGAPTGGWFANNALVEDPHLAYEYLESAKTVDWGWVPLQAPEAFENAFNPLGSDIAAGINRQNEKTKAIYASLYFGTDVFDGNVGVRVVETETTSISRSGAGGLAEECAATPSDDCAAAAAFITAFNAELGENRSFTNSYTNVLPSLNLRYALTEEVQLRFGLSRTMVRPNFNHTRPFSKLTFSFQGTQFNPNQTVGVGTGQGGSPFLKPTISDNVDASVEWYFDEAGSVTLALFYKDVEDFITPLTGRESFTYGGQTFDFEVLRQINGSEGTIQGFEIAYQQFFTSLPGLLSGFGVQTNYTYIDNQGGVNTPLDVFDQSQVDYANEETLPIEGMSNNSYNLALLYEYESVSARLAYNWRERYLLTTSAANLDRPVWFDDYGQLDGSVFYNITEKLKVGLQGTNLLVQQVKLQVSSDLPGVTPTYSWTDSDRRVALVLRYRF